MMLYMCSIITITTITTSTAATTLTFSWIMLHKCGISPISTNSLKYSTKKSISLHQFNSSKHSPTAMTTKTTCHCISYCLWPDLAHLGLWGKLLYIYWYNIVAVNSLFFQCCINLMKLCVCILYNYSYYIMGVNSLILVISKNNEFSTTTTVADTNITKQLQ